jgi:hypothetical protein
MPAIKKPAKKTAPAKKRKKADVPTTLKLRAAKQDDSQPEVPAKKLSQIAAAVEVLKTAGEPMTCKAMVEAMTAKGLWASPGGKTPEATLYTAVTMVPKCAPLGAFSKRAG